MKNFNFFTLLTIVFFSATLGSAQFGDVLNIANKANKNEKNQSDKKDKNKKDDKKADENYESELNLPPYYGPKKRLAVEDLEIKVTINNSTSATSTGSSSTTTIDFVPPSDFGTGLTEMMTTVLYETNRFVLLERKNFSDIQNEQTLNANPNFDKTSVAPGGRLLGAQWLIRGSITEYSYKKSSLGGSGSFGKIIGGNSVEADAMVALDIRIYDAATGQIIASTRAEGHAKSRGTAAQMEIKDLKIGGSGFSTTPLGHASRQALERAVKFIIENTEQKPWEATIAEVESEDANSVNIYVNAGSSMGLKVGNELDVWRPGREIIDPQTRVSIGRTKDKLLGKVRIENVTENLSIARVVEGSDFKIGDSLRFSGEQNK